ncbi:MAG TPA: HNH endonuclease [Bacilli bacterium]|nr:HNH endonuclease [Bacilli bacterium]
MTKINAVLPDELLKRYDYNSMSKEVRKIFNTVNLLKIRYDQVSMPTITSNYEIKYSSFVKRNNSKVEDYVVKKLTNEENLDKYLSKIVYAFSHLNQEEKIILVETYKKGTIDDETKKKYIYMRPILFNDLKVKEELEEVLDENNIKENNSSKKTRRLKQSSYRTALLDNMPFCPFTMVADDRLLVACHIKPFADCDTDDERYDSKNGITMTPTYHTLFDLGFISFEDDGTLLISPFLSNITKNRLSLKDGDRVRLQSGSGKYLKYHRDNIFCRMPAISLDDFEKNSK